MLPRTWWATLPSGQVHASILVYVLIVLPVFYACVRLQRCRLDTTGRSTRRYVLGNARGVTPLLPMTVQLVGGTPVGIAPSRFRLESLR